MPLPDMNRWEARPDFPSLVAGVQCPVCDAKPGKMCRDMHVLMTNGIELTRRDYHMARKYRAIEREGYSPEAA